MTANSTPQTNTTQAMLAAIEIDLRATLSAARGWLAPGIEEMVAYHLGWADDEEISGKRIRPLLTLLCCQASGGEWRTALPAAGAIEWIHNFSLIHDDIQDHSEIRRGRPTVWKIWGSPQAINTGDAIFALSRWSTQRLKGAVPAELILEIHRLLDETSLALTRGQHLDIHFETTDEVTTEAYLNMIHAKTAALLGTACQLGALLSPAPADQIEAYRGFGQNLGLAFQVIDDLLGIWGSTEQTGKSSADDLQTRKKTLPIIHGLEHSSEFQQAWGAKRHSEEELSSMRQMLDDSGSKEFTMRWAERYTQEAMSALKAADGQEPAASELTSLAARLLQRAA